jgi:hypothetical protein
MPSEVETSKHFRDPAIGGVGKSCVQADCLTGHSAGSEFEVNEADAAAAM